ncbi:MAG: hypothetical protein KC505_09395 [Myxococcales bacterium]|nr:hypothetical protein [Myxococcales bacterium]USN49831.1 MAG: hypothetical protein H6731_06010 [Myxococcales bacterium]
MKKYLNIYADIRIFSIQKNIAKKDFVLVIPAFKESDEFIKNLIHIKQCIRGSILLVVVFNQPDDCSEDERVINQNCLSALKSCQELEKTSTFEVVILGPYELARSKGVGLARKIGADFALRLIEEKIIATPIIFCSDADALLPRDYFERAKKSFCKENSAYVYNFFHHRPECQQHALAIELYEQRLDAYVAGLSLAKSPYAFHSIGSTIAISAEHYAMVRGFPPIAAGEDFYILNKLKKTGHVRNLNGDPIILSARVSDRVAFGTGPAMAKILKSDPKSAPLFYDERVFELLGQFLKEVERALLDGDLELNKVFSKEIELAFEHVGASKIKKNLKQRKNEHDRLKSFHDYFDALRTLRFVHYLRDNYFPNRNFYDQRPLLSSRT